MGKKMTLS